MTDPFADLLPPADFSDVVGGGPSAKAFDRSDPFADLYTPLIASGEIPLFVDPSAAPLPQRTRPERTGWDALSELADSPVSRAIQDNPLIRGFAARVNEAAAGANLLTLMPIASAVDAVRGDNMATDFAGSMVQQPRERAAALMPSADASFGEKLISATGGLAFDLPSAMVSKPLQAANALPRFLAATDTAVVKQLLGDAFKEAAMTARVPATTAGLSTALSVIDSGGTPEQAIKAGLADAGGTGVNFVLPLNIAGGIASRGLQGAAVNVVGETAQNTVTNQFLPDELQRPLYDPEQLGISAVLGAPMAVALGERAPRSAPQTRARELINELTVDANRIRTPESDAVDAGRETARAIFAEADAAARPDPATIDFTQPVFENREAAIQAERNTAVPIPERKPEKIVQARLAELEAKPEPTLFEREELALLKEGETPFDRQLDEPVAPVQSPTPSGQLQIGSPLANGFYAGPGGYRYRVSKIGATGGIALEKRSPSGDHSSFYVGKDGNLIDADDISLNRPETVERLWKPNEDQAAEGLAILQEMGALELSDPKRKELKARLRELVAEKPSDRSVNTASPFDRQALLADLESAPEPELIRNGTRVFYPGDVTAMRAKLAEAGLSEGMRMTGEDGSDVGLYFPAKMQAEVDAVLRGSMYDASLGSRGVSRGTGPEQGSPYSTSKERDSSRTGSTAAEPSVDLAPARSSESTGKRNFLPRSEMQTAPVGSWIDGGDVPGIGRTAFQIQNVPLDKISPVELDSAGSVGPEKQGDVTRYAEAMRNGAQFPNARGYELENGKINLVDGHRRLLAAKAAGQTSLRVAVRPLDENGGLADEVLRKPSAPVVNQSPPVVKPEPAKEGELPYRELGIPPPRKPRNRVKSAADFDPNYHDIRDFIALHGGLDAKAFAAEFNSEVPSPAENFRFFGKPLFRKSGGLQPDQLRELLQETGFLNPDSMDGVARYTPQDAYDLVDRALDGSPVYHPSGVDTQNAIQNYRNYNTELERRQEYIDEHGATPELDEEFARRADAMDRGDFEPVFSKRAKDRTATPDMFGATQRAQTTPTPRPASGDLFGAPTSRERLDAAQRDSDARLTGPAVGMRQGDGELFAGTRPEQKVLRSQRPDTQGIEVDEATPTPEEMAAFNRQVDTRRPQAETLRNDSQRLPADTGFVRRPADGTATPERVGMVSARGDSNRQAPARQVSPAADAQPDLTGLPPKFGDWFRSSKMKDEAAKPMEFHHATDADFEAFDPGRRGSATGFAPAGLGNWFSRDSGAISRYGSKLLSGHLRLENPKVMDSHELPDLDTKADYEALAKQYKDEGYDGLYFPDSKQAVAFDSVQFKSKDNSGAYSEDPRIRYSKRDPQTETPEFKRWFGDSKVVDAKGEPLRVYHGRAGDFTEFDTAGRGKTSGSGAFFTSSPAVSDTYATGKDPNVVPVYLNLKTPVVVDAGGANWSKIKQSAKVQLPETTVSDQVDEDLLAELEGRDPDKGVTRKLKAANTNIRNMFRNEWDYPDDTASTDDIARWARKQGYDGVIIKNVSDRGPSGRFSSDEAQEPSTLYVAFSPEQIKSATGNSGAFDPANPSILKSASAPKPKTARLTDDQVKAAKADAESRVASHWGRSAVNKLKTRGRVEFITKQEVLDQNLGNKELRDDIDTTDGFYDQKSGIAYVIADSNTPISERPGVFVHEIFHANGEKFLGSDGFKRLKEAFRKLRTRDKEIDAAYKRAESVNTVAEHLDEEGIAYLSQEAPKHRLSERLTDEAKLFLNRLGIPLDWLNAHAAAVRKIAALNLKDAGNRGRVARFTKDGVKYQKVFHGTPHRDIEKEGFKLQKIGTGEGAQAYGYGMYFAGRREVAEGYRKNLTRGPERYFYDGELAFERNAAGAPFDLTNPRTAAIFYVANDGLAGAKKYLASQGSWGKSVLEALQLLDPKKIRVEKSSGQLYSAEIPEDSDLLDYDKPLSEQPEKVRVALAAADFNGDEVVSAWKRNGAWEHVRGEMLYKHLAGGMTRGAEAEGKHAAASKYLQSIGIPGLRYLDGNSRNAGEGSHNYVIWDEALLTPEKAQITPYYSKRMDDTPQTETENFKRWSGGAPVFKPDEIISDYEGGPAVFELYHGTTADFDTFSNERANPESDMGAGFYFSNTPDDVGSNYAGLGPDLTNKIEREAERIAGETDREYNDPDVVAEARSKFMNNDGATLPVFVRTKNPAILGGEHETRLTYEESYDKETDEYGEPEGTLVDFIGNLREAASNFNDGDVEAAIASLFENGVDGDVALSDVLKTLKDSEEFNYYTDDEGNIVSNEVVRQALEWSGFDSVIDFTVDEKFGSQKRVGKPMKGMTADTVHVIAFKPNQIKSSIGNSGAFSDTNPSILASKRTRQDAEKDAAITRNEARNTLGGPTTGGDQTQTPAFRKWFGESKVVDADGKPLVVYHGTRRDFTKFRMGSAPGWGRGIYFTDNRDQAEADYGGGAGGRVVEAYLSIRNPWRGGFPGYEEVEGTQAWRSYTGSFDDVLDAWYEDGVFAGEVLRELGYDGVIAENSNDIRGLEIVVFDTAQIIPATEQIKSAIGNRGTFDPNNPSILASKRTRQDAEKDAEPTPRFNSATEFWTDNIGKPLFNMISRATKAVIANDFLKRHGLNLAEDMPPEAQKAWRAYKQDVGNLKKTVSEIADEAKNLSPEERAMVSDLVEREMKAGVTPPEAVVRMATLMTSIMRKQSKQLVETGMLSKDAADRWEGRYLPRFYQKHLLTNPFDAMLRKAYLSGIKGTHLKGRGLFETIPVEDVPAYEKMGWEVRDPEHGKKPSLKGLPEGSKVRVWRDFTPAERQKMGEVRDAMYRFARGYTDTQIDIAKGKLFDHIARTVARDDNPGGSYVLVPDTSVPGTGVKKFGNLAGKYVPGDVLSALKTKAGPDSDITRAYLKALSLWKEGKTSLNPVTHVNNVVSNLVMADLAGVNLVDPRSWKLYADTFNDYRKEGTWFKEAQKAGLFGGEWYGNEVAQWLPLPSELKDSGPRSIPGKFAMKTANALGAVRRGMGNLYRAEDQFFKLLLYKQARERGLEPNDAVTWAEKFVFDYSTAAPGVTKLKNTLFPFANYSSKAVPALTFAATHYPWRIAKWLGLLSAFSLYSFNTLYGDDDEDMADSEAAMLPDYLKGRSSFFGVPKAIRLPYNDESTGDGMYVDISRFVPLGDLFDAENQSGGVPLPAPLTPNNPIITTAIAMLANKDSFTGKDIVRESDTGGEAAQKRIGWLYRQMAPNNPLVPGSYNFNRIGQAVSAMAGEPIGPYTGLDYNGNTISPGRALAQTFGIKLRSVDFEKEMDFQIYDLKREISDLKGQKTKLKKNQSISDETLEKELDKLDAKIESVQTRLYDLQDIPIPQR